MKAAIISGSFEPYQLAEIKDIPQPKLKENEILIKAVAFAINQLIGSTLFINWAAQVMLLVAMLVGPLKKWVLK